MELEKISDINLSTLIFSQENSGKYSILSFGCGVGTKDQAILKAISSCLSEEAVIIYHAVDPDASQLEKFKKAVHNGDERKEPFKKVYFDFFAQTFEDYIQNKDAHLPSKADLILFIDSLCHFTSSTEHALVHCYKTLLAQNGVMLITLWNSQDFWFKIREIYGKGRASERKLELEGNDYLTIQEAEEIVKQRSWNFQLLFPEYTLDITECFNSNSKDGKHLLECLACFSNVKEEVDSDPKKLIDFLHESELVSGAKHLLKGNQGTLLIYKKNKN